MTDASEIKRTLDDVVCMRIFLRWHIKTMGFGPDGGPPAHAGVTMLWVMLRQAEMGGN